MMPLAASPLYGFLYKQTVASFPGAFLLLNVSLYLVVIILVVWVYRAMKRAGLMDTVTEMDNMEHGDNKEKLLKQPGPDGTDTVDGPIKY